MLQSAGAVFLFLALLPTGIRLFRGSKKYDGKHILVTGGSQGIGKDVAMEFARRGAHVTLLARTEANLKAAIQEVKGAAKADDQKFEYVVADVTDYASVEKAVASAIAKLGPIDVLIANAGTSMPAYFMEQDVKDFQRQMQVNYLGVVHSCKAVAPGMCDRRQGQICLVSSAAAVVSFIGYASYAPTKWAIRGFGDSIRNELCGFGVSVHVAYPPDTATPGYDAENKTKPKECSDFSKIIGGAAYPPRQVASCLINGMASGLYHLPSPDWLQNRLVDTMAGVSPRNNAVLEWAMMPVLCAIEWAFRFVIDHFGRQYGQKAKRE